MIYVYVIQSTKKKFRYVGITKNIPARLRRHNAGNNKSTKAYAPFILVLKETYPNYSKARERETFLEGGQGRKFLDKVLL